MTLVEMPSSSLRRGLLAVLAALAFTGCLKPHVVGVDPPSSAETIEARVAFLEARLIQSGGQGLEGANRANVVADDMKEFREQIETLLQQITDEQRILNQRIDELQRKVGQSTAPAAGATIPGDSAVAMKQMDDRLNDLTQKYNAILYVLRDRKIMTADPAVLPKDPSKKEGPKSALSDQALFDAAYEDYQAGRLAEARSGLADLLATYPKSPLADKAQYYLGECHFSLKKFDLAASEFAKLIKEHPDSPKRCKAMLRMGEAFKELNLKSEAKATFDKVGESCRGTEEAASAATQKKKIK